MSRVNDKLESAGGRSLVIREAVVADANAIRALFTQIYGGKYPLPFGSDPGVLMGELADSEHYLWIVTEDAGKLIGTMMFAMDPKNRMSKSGGGTVLPEYRKDGLASRMLRLGIKYLTEEAKIVDVLYGTSRTISEGPSRMVADAGFHKLGIFPNAVQIEDLEHLNLDIFLTPAALEQRRKKPYLTAPFFEIHKIARGQLDLERAYLVTEREPLKISGKKMAFKLVDDERHVIEMFRKYSAENRISNSFFPFHAPNWMLSSEDGGTDFFVWQGGVGKQASIMGFRTDHVNLHEMLDSVALTLQKSGVAYVELLVDAYDYIIQQHAYTAKFIPSAYFPALRLASDGLRDDYLVVSRTFQILDFTRSTVTTDGLPYLEAYMKFYKQLYIDPFKRADIRKK